MGEQNFPDNVLYELDNLDVLRGMNSETVDLIATDPPFNTRRNRAGTAGFYVDNWKWGDTGILPDQWAWNEVHPVWLEQIKDDNPALYEVIDAARACHGEDIAAFLCFLSVRLLEMHRVLKPTGSIYLHCDHTANAYIRMAMDAVFGAKQFRNEIVWERSNGRSDSKSYARVHDTIFLYAKSSNPTWNQQYQPLDPHYIAAAYTNEDARGLYMTAPLRGRGVSGGTYSFTWKGVSADDWRFPKYSLDELDAQGLIHWPKKEGGIPRRKSYLRESPGVAARDVITDVGYAPRSERTGSPDQKPLALYERMILASSNSGDLVLDPFAGCATTIIAARKHGRRWVGVDRRKDARFHVVTRMMGIKAADAEKIQRERPDLNAWLDEQLAQYDAHYRTEAPQRSDTGEHAAPELGQVFVVKERSLLTHAQMLGLLVEQFGLRCWGCDFKAPSVRYLHLDHISPKSEGGSNDLENRALLCQVCNLDKSNTMTLTQLCAVSRRRRSCSAGSTLWIFAPRGPGGVTSRRRCGGKRRINCPCAPFDAALTGARRERAAALALP